MTAIVLNDTRFDQHIGCDIVIATVTRELSRRGVQVTKFFTLVPELEAAPETPEYLSARLVVLNGEGSMHHDGPRNLAMLRLCEQARAAGKRTALINSVWQENVTSNDFLKCFDVVSLRDRRSWEAASPHRAGAGWVPDLTLASGFFAGRWWPRVVGKLTSPRVSVLVTDSVVKPVHRRLAELTRDAGWPFVPMGNYGKSLLDAQPDLQRELHARGLDCRPDNPAMRSLFERCEAVVAGRFHAVCLAVLAGKPFLAVASNTHKIESMVEEIGLDPRVLLSEEDITPARVRERLTWAKEYFGTPAVRAQLAVYHRSAMKQATELFDRVVFG